MTRLSDEEDLEVLLVRGSPQRAQAAFAELLEGLDPGDLAQFKNFVYESFEEADKEHSLHVGITTKNRILNVLKARLPVLALLMVLQSFSSFVLNSYSEFIQQHMVVALYLTMLVGAGGNAGNQSAVLIIPGIATGKINSFSQVVPELLNALALGCSLVVVGFSRVYLFGATIAQSVGISLSLFLIVSTSVVVGAVLPLGLLRLGFDAPHAGPTIQVIMDISGVWITCAVCWTLSKSGWGF